MSTNRKSIACHRSFRKIGMQKYKKDEGRQGARPPDAWDDVSLGRENRAPYRHCKRMIGRFDKDPIIRKLVDKWSLSSKEAEEVYDFCKWQVDNNY